MRFASTIGILLALAGVANAQTAPQQPKCLVLDPNEEAGLARLFEAASGAQEIRSGGVAMARLVTYFANKLAAAQSCPPPPPKND